MVSTTGTQAMKAEQGLLELSLLNAETSSASFDDVVVDALHRGIPPELVTRLKELWEKTKMVAGEIVAIGKIIVTKIVEFLRSNPKLTVGLALGAAVAALIGGIPLLGPLLQPLAMLIGTVYGAGVGAAMENGDFSGSPFTAVAALADKFFELFRIILNSVASYFAAWSFDAMKNILKGFGAAVSFAAEKVESNAPLIKAKLADVGRSIDVAASASKKIIAEKTAEASELAQRVAADERTQRLVANISTGLSNAKENITSAITSTIQRQETKSLTGPETVDTPEGQEQTKIVSAIEKLSGRDKVGVSAEVLGAAGGAAAGVAAAGTVAGLAGATTLLGSTGLASLLGGIFVTTTPVGWVIGSAALAGAAGYGLVRMVRSGAHQDRTRQEIVKRLSKRLEALQEESTEKDLLLELTQLVAVTLAAGLITEDHGQRIVGLVEKGTLSSKIAVDRIKAIAVEAGVIVPVNPSQISLANPRT